MTRGKTHCLQVWGELACFTRPEMKVERYSYPVITPSAARGILDAIYWKASYGFYWQLESVEILSPPKYLALRRNEVKDKAPPERTIKTWMEGREMPEPIWADGSKDELGTDQKGRTQRQTMALKNVHYRLHAHMRIRRAQIDLNALDSQFIRRASHGKCFYQPFLGCREFPAWFELGIEETNSPSPVPLDLDLGYMLYDVFDLGIDNDAHAKPAISVFHAQVMGGVMRVPGYEEDAVKKACGEEFHA
ncbi:MAG: type I-C CRISPR-associated protein Cas5c [Gammaproteobacteria bacterium]